MASDYCACRDCFETVSPESWHTPVLCDECKEAGCHIYAHRPNLDFEGGPEYACKREDES